MYGRFTEKAEKAISLSQESAAKLGHSYVGTEHLLLGLLKRRYRGCCQGAPEPGSD